MKRSTQIGLAAAGFVAVAGTASYFLTPDEPPVMSEAMNACTVGGVRTARECAEDIKQAASYYEKEVAPLANAVPASVPEETSVAAAAPSAGTSSARSSGGGMTFMDWYLWNQLMNNSSGRSGYNTPTPSQYYAPSNAFSRAGNPSQYRPAPDAPRPAARPQSAPSSAPAVVARPTPSAPSASVPSVVSRGGFGSTAPSMGGSSST